MIMVRSPARRVLVAVLAVAACSTARVVSDHDPSVRFSSLHSFTVRRHPSTSDSLVDQHTFEAIEAELTRKGFTYVTDPTEADFEVDFTIGTTDRLDLRSFPSPHGGAWLNGGWSGNQVDVNEYEEDTLAIDVFDARTHRPVWHGSARKKLSQGDIAISHIVIREAVTAVLAQFPPKET